MKIKFSNFHSQRSTFSLVKGDLGRRMEEEIGHIPSPPYQQN